MNAVEREEANRLYRLSVARDYMQNEGFDGEDDFAKGARDAIRAAFRRNGPTRVTVATYGNPRASRTVDFATRIAAEAWVEEQEAFPTGDFTEYYVREA